MNLTPDIWGFHLQHFCFPADAGCSVIHFSSDTVYWELPQNPEVKGSVP